MIALIQRVTEASVTARDAAGTFVETGRIAAGLVALVCAERGDTERACDRLLDRVVGYRVFADEAGKMNRSLVQAAGGLLIVSQFTLAADTASGARPSFTPAADAALAERLYERFVRQARERLGTGRTGCGRFGADMRVALVNDGPVTFWLRVAPQG